MRSPVITMRHHNYLEQLLLLSSYKFITIFVRICLEFDLSNRIMHSHGNWCNRHGAAVVIESWEQEIKNREWERRYHSPATNQSHFFYRKHQRALYRYAPQSFLPHPVPVLLPQLLFRHIGAHFSSLEATGNKIHYDANIKWECETQKGCKTPPSWDW